MVRFDIYEEDNNKYPYTAEIQCPHCQELKYIPLTNKQFDGLKQYANNNILIQDALPDMDADLREMFISGICPDCWNKLFEQDDDE